MTVRVFSRLLLLLLLMVSTACLSTGASAEDWPGWRGPRGDGSAVDADPPLRWDGESGRGIAWKRKLPGRGHGSPIIHGRNVFLLTCIEETGARELLCLHRDSGRIRWRAELFRGPLETIHRLNSRASSTPATDGKLVFSTFLKVDGRTVPAPNVGTPRPITPGVMVVAAHTVDGEKKWQMELGEFVSAHGFSTCPVLFEDLVILNGDHDGKSYIAALRKATGEVVWRKERKYGIRSYVTPIIRKIGERTQLVLSGSKCVVSLDPRTGREWWRVEGPTEQFVASMVFDGERFFLAGGYPSYHVMAVDPTGSGDVTDTHVAWHVRNAQCYVPSPVVVNDKLIVANDGGVAGCFETKTGKRLWQARLGRHFSASLLTVGDLVYLVADDGVTSIIRPGAECEEVARNKLGEYTYASPALSDGQLFIRGEEHLFCIER